MDTLPDYRLTCVPCSATFPHHCAQCGATLNLIYPPRHEPLTSLLPSDNEKPAFGGWKNGGGGFGAKKQGGFNELPKGGGFAQKGGGGGGFAKAAFSKGVNGGGGFFAAKKTEVFDDQKRPFGGGFAQTKTLKFGTKLSEKSAPKPNFGKSLFKAAAEPGPAKTKPTTNAKTEWGPMDRGKIEDDPWIGDGSDGVLEVKDKLELDGDRPLFCTDIIVRAGGTLTVKAWNGKTGGELRLRASGSVTVEEGGVIDVSGCGYRGPLADKAVNNYNNAADKQGEPWPRIAVHWSPRDECLTLFHSLRRVDRRRRSQKD